MPTKGGYGPVLKPEDSFSLGATLGLGLAFVVILAVIMKVFGPGVKPAAPECACGCADGGSRTGVDFVPNIRR